MRRKTQHQGAYASVFKVEEEYEKTERLKLSNFKRNIQEIYGTILIIKIRGYIYQTDNKANYNLTMSKRSVQAYIYI